MILGLDFESPLLWLSIAAIYFALEVITIGYFFLGMGLSAILVIAILFVTPNELINPYGLIVIHVGLAIVIWKLMSMKYQKKVEAKNKKDINDFKHGE